MQIEDYGEEVELKVCNLLWQPVETKKFDTIHEAWEEVKDLLDDHFIRMDVRRDKDKKMLHKMKFFKDFENNNYIVSNTSWENVMALDSIDEVYEKAFALIINKEGV